MPKLRLFCEGELIEELELKKIDEKLNEVLKDAEHFSSPGNSPTVEHPKDLETGHLKTGSEVFVPPSYLENYYNQNSFSGDYVTYTFQVVWDENLSQHDIDKHWNLRIFKSIHFQNGKPQKDYYDISNLKKLNHIKKPKIKLELLDDSGKIEVSREFICNEEKQKIIEESLK
ncbi:MAG: hypothetical protein AABY06_02810 [Nanoarchaeota archaeon]